MTCQRVTGDGCIWEGLTLMNVWMLADAASVKDSSSFKC